MADKSEQRKKLPWIEKYRPCQIDDIIGDDVLLQRINKIIAKRDMPNIILSGVPGTGKTTTIYCIARALLGKYRSEYMYETNASDERGIKAVQERISNFCMRMISIPDKTREYAKHKIIFLDEADNMTQKAQMLICDLIEKYPNTRFAFTCNNSSDIIESIQSKCTILRYKKIKPAMIKKRLLYVCEREELQYDDTAINELAIGANGDLRTGLNNLQLMANSSEKITLESVSRVYNKPQTSQTSELVTACYERDLKQAITLVNKLKKEGYSYIDIVYSMMTVIKAAKMDDDDRIMFLKELCQTYTLIKKGYDNDITLNGCIAALCT